MATAKATACTAQRRVTRFPDISSVSQLGNNPHALRQAHGSGMDTGSPARRVIAFGRCGVAGRGEVGRGLLRMLEETFR